MGAWHHDTVGPLDFVELSNRLPVEAQADLEGGFLSDSLRESPQKIGIADRPEAGT
ncbi:MAG: hypothetical protein V2B13_12370 [Pseudomonadota bacterium]